MHLSKRIHRDFEASPAIELQRTIRDLGLIVRPPALSLSRGRIQSELWGHPYRLATAVVRSFGRDIVVLPLQ
jgi:hypothetical protein